MGSKKWFKPGPSELIILIVIGVLFLIVITGNVKVIWETLYSPYSALLAIVMLVEYLLLKGGDRTALYERELEAARQTRNNDLLAMREMETQLVELRTRAAHAAGTLEGPDSQPLLDVQQSCEDILSILRSRI